ncbi:ribonuclease III [Gimibacter soli]|uniref:Ribonuclease 3 n=1 Tax=Gimibacter soli TaxID=3024400 RepID=A0AAF0BMM9_9PROT|nr:ribonuclease III [Gimibacter soli]WCL55742.1 ribonuclease III [Gimibacter soli]
MSLHSKVAGYTFTKVSLLDEALTHPSLSGSSNYQRLEFLGDRVLGLVIAEWLLDLFPGEAEGKINRRFTGLVRRETLADMAETLGLVPLIKLNPGAEQEGTRDKAAIRADITEAVIGALYLDGGFPAAKAFIRKHWKPLLDGVPSAAKDNKTQLQEWAQARSLPLPTYEVVSCDGPDHSPVFTIRASIDGVGAAEASGTSKRIAQQSAAEALLETIDGDAA